MVFKNKMVVTYVDFKNKAYNSIDKQMLGKILNRDPHGTTQGLITKILTNIKARMRFKGVLSKTVDIKTAFKQGD